MRPSEVRSSVLSQHEHIRGTLEAASEAAQQVLAGASPDGAGLATIVGDLASEMETHIGMENAHLVPAVREADAWGPQRAQRILDEHDAQLETLARISSSIGHTDSKALARDTLALVSEIRDDMRREEDELLRPDFLRDDVIVVEQFDG